MELQTIGDALTVLGLYDPAALVYIDNRAPTALSSYRGYYNDLAIERHPAEHEETRAADAGPSFDMPESIRTALGYSTYTPGIPEVVIAQPPTVGEFSKALSLALGKAFEGYKGGQYVMGKGTFLWVSEYGQCDQLRLSHVEDMGDRIDFFTRRAEGW